MRLFQVILKLSQPQNCVLMIELSVDRFDNFTTKGRNTNNINNESSRCYKVGF